MPFADPQKQKDYNREYGRARFHKLKTLKPEGTCSHADCSRPTEAGRKKCGHHLAYMREYRKKNRPVATDKQAAGKCARSDCSRPSDHGLTSCSICRARAKKNEDSKRGQLNKTQNSRNKLVRQEVYAAYGGKCLCCGEDRPEFLSLDHVDGYSKGPRKGSTLAAWAKRNGYPTSLRLLCMNCNFCLGHYGYCAHQNGLMQVQRTGRPTTRAVPEEEKRARRAYWKEYKLEVFAHYGGPKCICCGDEHLEFLQMDHIDGSGAEHRRQEKGAKNIMSWLRMNGYPPGFRVLCVNCNFALGHFGYCPHGGILQQEAS